QGEVEEALAICAARMKEDASRAEATALAGKILARNGRPDEARRRLEEALEQKPDDPMIHAELGGLAARGKDLDGAIRHCEQALGLRPDWPEMAAHLARVRQARAAAPR